MSTHRSPSSVPVRALLLAAGFAASALFPASAPAQAALSDADKQTLKQEIAYVDALNRAGFADYADLVLRDVQAKFPQAKAILKVKMLEQVLALGKFDEAQEIIDKEPKDAPETWAMRLTMADYLFARGRYDDAFGTYDELFKKYGSNPPEAIVEFYVNSYYKFSQMLKFQKKDKEAAEALEKLLQVKGLPSDMKRPVLFEEAQLYVKVASEVGKGGGAAGYLAKAKAPIEALLWNQDVWFGRAVALMAHCRVIEGKAEEAEKLVDEYMPMLVKIEEALIEAGKEDHADYLSLSPIPECRYLMGTMFADEADKIVAAAATMTDKAARYKEEDKAISLYGMALPELINVYVKYPSYSWATDAMARHEKINRTLEDLGCDVQDTITPAQKADVAKKQFETAHMFYHQNQFEKAVAQFESVLKNFPEVVPDSINALGTLAQCAVEIAETCEEETDRDYWILYSQTVTGHLAERFCRAPRGGMSQAGDALRTMATFYSTHNLPEVSKETTDLFFDFYPEHSAAANTLMAQAEKAYRDENYDEAMPLYTKLTEKYQKNAVSWTAARRLADCYGKLGRPLEELAARSNYLARVEARSKKKPGADLIVAQYAYLKCLRTLRADALRAATIAYDQTVRGVAPAPAAAEDGEAKDGEERDPVAKATAELKTANDGLRVVINEYTKLIKRLAVPEERKKYEVNEKEKKLNDQILQSAFFDHAFCLASLNLPEAKLPGYKQAAIKDYEKILELFPDSHGVPIVLLQLGTLYSTLRAEDEATQAANTEKASKYFEDLAKNHPDSEQAKNALYLQAKALMDMGIRAEAIKTYAKMINAGGKYTPLQLANAAEELAAAQAWEESEKGFQAALAAAKPDDTQLRTKIELGLIQNLVARKEYVPAAERLDKFVEANPRYFRITDALELLRTACVEAAVQEKDTAKRNALFNKAIAATNKLKPYRKGDRANMDLQLQVGDIIEKQLQVAKEVKSDDAEALLNTAANYYQRIITTVGANPKNADIFDPLAQVYRRSIRTLLEMKRYSDGTSVYPDVQYECAVFMKLFPKAEPRLLLEIRSAHNEATREINASGEEPGESVLVSLMGDAPPMVLPEPAAEIPAEEEAPEAEAPAEETPAEEAAAEEAAES